MILKNKFLLLLFVSLLMASIELPAKVLKQQPLLPTPQKMTVGKMAWKVPSVFSVFICPEFSSEQKMLEQTILRRCPKARVQTTEKAKAIILIEKYEGEIHPDTTEGYDLTVSKDGIVIRAQTAAGAFYGIQTLDNLLLNATSGIIPCLHIKDYPSLAHRWGNIHMTDLRKETLPDVKKMIDLFASMKYNGLIFNLFQGFPYKDLKFKRVKDAITRQDLIELLDYCRERHLEVIPGLQLLSHVRWILSLQNADPLSLLENRKEAVVWGCNWCPSNPTMRDIWQKAVAEHIEVFRPRYFYIFMDEILQGSIGTCPLCKGTHPNDLVLQEFRRYYDFLKARGVTPIICHDAFRDPTKTRDIEPCLSPFQGWVIRKQFPRDVIINYWGYGPTLDTAVIKDFTADGFQLLGGGWCTCFGNSPVMGKAIRDLGKKAFGAVSFAWYFYSYAPKGGLLSLGYRTWPGIMLSGECFWNADSQNVSLFNMDFDPTSEARRRIETKAPPANIKWTPVSIHGSLDTDLKQAWSFPVFSQEGLKDLQADYAALPEHFDVVGEQNGGYLRAVVSSGHPKGADGFSPAYPVIPLNNLKADSLSFLAAILPTNDFDLEENEWYSFGGNLMPRVGTFRVKWANGRIADIPLRRAGNISNWNAQACGYGERFGARHHDKQGRLVQFSIVQWKNPMPNWPIASVQVFSRYYRNRAVALFALSAANASNLPPKATLPTKRYTGRERKNQADGASQAIKATEYSQRKLLAQNMSGPMQVTVEPSPWDKTKKAFHFVGKAKAPFGRMCCDLPISVPAFAMGFGFRVKISAPESVNDGAFYLLDAEVGKQTGAWIKTLPKPVQKEMTILAEHRSMVRENGLIDPKKATWMRLSFRVKPTPHPMEIWLEIPTWYQYPGRPIFWHKDVGSKRNGE